MNKQSICFANNHQAFVVLPAADASPDGIVKALGISAPKAVILIIGGADSIDSKLMPKLTQLFGRGIARAALEAEAVIIDGGTQAGVMSLMGEGVAARGYKSTLIGVAPAGKVTYPGSAVTEGISLEPNHSHFVLVEGSDWGNETTMLFSLLSHLTIRDESKVPAVAILTGGGNVSKEEVLRSVRQGLPLIIVEGSGGLADAIAAGYKLKDSYIEDPVLAEIISDGELHFHLLDNSVKGVERLIIRELGIDKVLMQAWEAFANYDHNANLQQKHFDRMQLAIIALGVAGTGLVIFQQVFAPRDTVGELKPVELNWVGFQWWATYHLLIIIPILLTLLITAANRFKQGHKWLLLRAGAESIKREIFRYRTRAMDYVSNAEQRLARKVEEITRHTMRTEVNLSALKPYNKDKGFPPYMYAAQGGDDGFSCLTPDQYVEVRLGDQLNYFQKKTLRLEKQLKWLYWLTFIVGGIGTYMAAIGMQAWVAFTTSIAAAFGTYLGYRQTENTLTKYNQTATDLSGVRAWWDALSSEEQSRQANINSLVEHTERVLESELDGWIQQMQNALADLRKGQGLSGDVDEKEAGDEGKSVPDPSSESVTVDKVNKSATYKEDSKKVSQKPAEEEAKISDAASQADLIKPIGTFE